MSKKRLPTGQKTLEEPEVIAIKEFESELGPTFNMEVICPFCAFKGRVIEFRTKKSSQSVGYSAKMFECPDCHEKMRRDTIMRDMTVSEWARWLYNDVIKYGGYKRISFPKLSARLKEYGWASEFWEAWKAVKEGRQTSSVEDFIDYVKETAQANRDVCEKYQQHIGGRFSMTCTTCNMYKECWPKQLERTER